MNVSGEYSSLSAPGMSGSLHPVERPEKASFWIGRPDAKEKEGKGEARPTVIFHKVPLSPFGCRNCDNFRRLQHLHMKDLHGSQALIIPAPATRADSQNICLRELRVHSPSQNASFPTPLPLCAAWAIRNRDFDYFTVGFHAGVVGDLVVFHVRIVSGLVGFMLGL